MGSESSQTPQSRQAETGGRVVYFNGEIVPEAEALVSFRDRGFKYGDAVFDTTRTFGHEIFRLDEHIDRLFKSLHYLQIDPVLSADEYKSITMEVLEANLPLIAGDNDYWVTQRVSRGIDTPDIDATTEGGPTVIIECLPLPLKERATLFRDGIEVVIPSIRRTPPDALSPRVKTNNYLNLIMGDLEAKARNPKAWAILLDSSGNLSEGIGSNFFTVTDGVIRTPRSRFVLGGISRDTVMSLGKQLDIPIIEEDIDLYDAVNADEVFLTSTSLCVCPVSSVNGVKIGADIPGPITKALTNAYIDLVDYDFVSQYLSRLEA
ncbi:MAG: aminotransferase class IV [Chloroflexi bacterium]|nr:aminotransferase class IV [Chloroflexota bacterium]